MRSVKYFIVGILICIATCLICVNKRFEKVEVQAETETFYYTAQQYTENDILLGVDEPEVVKEIGDFADEVKNANSGTLFPEITQVIPRQYMESTETNAV